jgi:glycosyltransferase involved in cell wall biosynthesis
MLRDKTLLITGGTGTFGNAVLNRFLDKDLKEIRIFSRDEKKQHDMRLAYNNPKLKFYIGNVRHPASLRDAMSGVDMVFHAAARLPDMRVLMAGQVLDAELEPLIAQTPNVDFRGWLVPGDALLLNFESDIIFSFYDPVSEINRRAASNKWSDAMMASKPILVNREVLKSAWIQEEDIGYLCSYNDVDALVLVLQHIRSHPREAQHKGERGRRLYDAGYSWAVMEQRLWEVLEATDTGERKQ